MKRTTGVALVLVVLLLSLSSCLPASLQEGSSEPATNGEAAESKIAELTRDLASLGHLYESLQIDYEDLQQDYADLQADYEGLRAGYDTLQNGLGESTLRDPTWSELKEFIKNDNTDTFLYSEGNFDCEGFAITLRDRAWRHGFRCAFVALNFAGTRGHALNAFQTVDRGIVYVDVTEHDKIAYVQIGQPYGTISLEAAKSEYFGYSGKPDEFWGTLTQVNHSDPFGYGYYISYRQRFEFFNQSVNAFNEAASKYNQGSTKWSSSQLDQWHKNLEALEKDLGSPVYEPLGIVATAEVYWN